MTTARAVYSDLVLINFSISATSFPTQTQVVNLLIALYVDAYRVVYGSGYQVYDAADEDPIIDTPEGKQIIIQEAEEIVQAWNLSGPLQPPPSSEISKQGEKKFKTILKRSATRMTNVRVFGEIWDDC